MCHYSNVPSLIFSYLTWVSFRYIVSFLLDSSVGLLVIYACIRLTVKLADKWKWRYLYFGEYGWYFKIYLSCTQPYKINPPIFNTRKPS